MKLGSYFCIFVFMPLTISCSIIPKIEGRFSDQNKINEAKFKQGIEEVEINNAEKELSMGHVEEALERFSIFQEEYAQSPFFQSARLGEAQSLEGLGHWAESEKIYRDVYFKTMNNQPQIAALALYRLSFVYESLGDDLKTLTTLLDCKKYSDHLPEALAKATIPARLATAYIRLRHQNEALKYLALAQKGIDQLKSQNKKITSSWLGNIYFQMGSISTNQLSNENYEQATDIQKMVQVYLLKAIMLNDPVWSERSVAQMKSTYQDLFNTFALPISSRSKKNIMGGCLIDLIEQAELFKTTEDGKLNKFENEFFTFLSVIRLKTENILYQPKETNFLTEESEMLNSIRRIGRRTIKELRDAERKIPSINSDSLPLEKAPVAEDPNL